MIEEGTPFRNKKKGEPWREGKTNGKKGGVVGPSTKPGTQQRERKRSPSWFTAKEEYGGELKKKTSWNTT